MKLLKFILCMSIILFAFPAMSEIYKYVDEYGNTHFTDDFSKVPVEQRSTVDASVEYENDTDAEQVTDPEASYDTDDDFTDESVEEVEEFADDSENQDEMVDSSEEADEEQIVALDQDTEDEVDLLATFEEAKPEKDLNAIRNQLEVLKKEIGEQKAANIMKQGIYHRGLEIGRPFKKFAPVDLNGLKDAFLDFIPDGGKMFNPQVRRCDDSGLEIQMRCCPLKAAWQDAGLKESDIARMCDIAAAVDKGTFEGAGFGFAAETWKPGQQGCCRLKIKPGN